MESWDSYVTYLVEHPELWDLNNSHVSEASVISLTEGKYLSSYDHAHSFQLSDTEARDISRIVSFYCLVSTWSLVHSCY